MSDNTPNFPDVLGYITGGERANISVAQLALAVRPRVVRAGRSFEVILLVQNAADVDIDVMASLIIPETDARRQKGRFVSKKSRLVVGLRPAEVGYVILPLSCLPDTAVSDDYRIGMEVAAKALKKPARVRQADGGGSFDIDNLPDDKRDRVEELRGLRFSGSKRFGLRDVLETPFSVMPGKVGQMVDFNAGWVSLWTMADMADIRGLLSRYGSTMIERVLPMLRREYAYAPLLHTTVTRFAEAGYPLHDLEAVYITKSLMRVLEMAMPRDNVFDYLASREYNVALTIKEGIPDDGSDPSLPRWAAKMLRAVSQNEQVAAHPAAALTQLMYTDLVYDSIFNAFSAIKTATGEEMGTHAEITAFAERVVEMLTDKREMDILHAYMPLVLGGIVMYERIYMPDDDLGEQLRGMADVLAEREPEHNSDNDFIFTMARQLVNRSLQKYGIQI